MNLNRKSQKPGFVGRYVTILAVLPVLGACDVSVDGGPSAIFYFREGTADDMRRCPPELEKDWHTAKFEFGGNDLEFVSPLGLICVKDASGKYVGTYVSAANGVATHQLEEGGSRNLISRGPVFKPLAR